MQIIVDHITAGTWFQQEAGQAEPLSPTGVVNQEAKLHCLQQHDNPFNT